MHPCQCAVQNTALLQQAQSQIADLAIEAASKVVGANLDDANNRRIVDEFLAEETSGEGKAE